MAEAVLSPSEASTAVKEVRDWRLTLRQVADRNPGGKLATKASALLLDFAAFEELVEQAGGRDELAFLVAAQVASGVSLRAWCEHYAVDRGLVWAMLSETEDRLARYYRALEGVAEEYVGDVVGIADDADEGKCALVKAKLRIDSRLKTAGLYSRKRFGDEKGVNVGVGVTVEIRRFAELPGAVFDVQAGERAGTIDVTPVTA